MLASQPPAALSTTLTTQEAWLLGALVAQGDIGRDGSGGITCADEAFLAEAASCWERVAAGTARKTDGPPSALSSTGTPVLELEGNRAYLGMVRAETHTPDGLKRIPKRILNASTDLQRAFLAAYNLGAGVSAGTGGDVFKAFRTTSPVLAAGLVWLARTALGRRVSVYLQPSSSPTGKRSYLVDLGSGLVQASNTRAPRPQNEVRRVDRRPFRGWMCDLATETGRFAAGVGLVVVHNSPRRGETFVTRKITRAVARIKEGIQQKLYLGNLDARRDWGYAPEYVEAMWLMLQEDKPDDFVIATGEAHSVREFAELAFGHVDLDWERYVEIDPTYYRPSEVDLLQGDSSKAARILGWRPRTPFPELVRLMIEADVQLLEDELSGRLVRQDRDH